MSRAQKSIEELLIEQGEFHVARQRIGMERQALQSQIAELNARCSTHIPSGEYRKIQNQRQNVVKQIGEKETELAAIKVELTEIQTVLEIRRRQSMGKAEIKKLVEMRDKWHGFSMEAGNHQKAREAAWQFSQELREILKKFFDANVEAAR